MIDWGDDDVDDEEPPAEVKNACRCGECCRRLLIEVDLADAEREPIAEKGTPLYTGSREVGDRELAGYLLNKVTPDGHACVFLDEPTNLCTIYETRPAVCRAFDCEGEGLDQLIELGYKPPREGASR